MKIFLVFATLLGVASTAVGQTVGETCPFMEPGRTSKAVTNLGNCTWYETGACCERAEVSSVFAEMLPLQDASTQCRNRMNYLMCYFCSPKQSVFIQLVNGVRQTTICTDFCNDVLTHCGGALYKGKTLSSQYTSGRRFCEQNGFKVDTLRCLNFDPKAFPSGANSLVHLTQVYRVTLFGLLFAFAAVILV